VCVFVAFFCEDFLIGKHRRLISSQMAEDLFNRMKALKSRHFNKKLRVASAMEVCLDKEVVTAVNKYTKPPTLAASQSSRLTAAPPELFSPVLGGTDYDLTGIASYSAKKSWYGTNTERDGLQYSDRHITRFCGERRAYDKQGDAWLSVFVNPTFDVLIRARQLNTGAVPTFFCLDHIPGGVGFGWPALLISVPGHLGALAWEPDPNGSITPLVIVDPGHWQAVTYEWKSPAWQFENWPGARGHLPHAGRAVVTDPQALEKGWQPLITVAAWNGFWTLGKDTIKKLMDYLGVGGLHLDSNDASLFETLSD
jgi:hypothetical protein